MMKKILSILLLFSLCFSFTACDKPTVKEITCEEIITAYEDVGYTVKYHNHHVADIESGVVCNIQIDDPENPERNYLYIDRYTNGEKAERAAKEGEWNLAIWFVFAVSGETRWLKSECYGDIHYHTFDNKIVKPLENLM